MKILGLIPARAGSKSIPFKNIVPLAGKALLVYTCIAAFQSKYLSRIILSTDSKKIAAIGRLYNVEIPFLRPKRLALDKTPSIGVVLHALNWLQINNNWQPDAVVLLQPTSPLRTSAHIDEAINLFKKTKADTVVSVMELPHKFSPYCAMQIRKNQLYDFWKKAVGFDRFRRQELPPLYARNGPAVLITRTSVILKKKSFYGERIVPYIMHEQDSIDIDTAFDLEITEHILSKKGKKN